MKIILVLVLCAIGVAIAASPARPAISPTFHAQVSVSLRRGTTGSGKTWVGGGIYAYDIKNNRARLDYKLEDQANREHYLFLQSLQRYDLHTVFTIDDEKCAKRTVNGQLDNPWDFVAQSTYTGSGTYRGSDYDEWQYENGDYVARLAVRSNNVNKPVYLITHDVVNGEPEQFDTIFEEFDAVEPETWVFYIPLYCQNITSNLLGDVNAVVYFANTQWNCVNVGCSSRVPAGTGQPAYECAEFAARSLAAGGYLPGLSSTAAQSAYSSYRGYNLCLVTGLHSALQKLGFASVGAVQAAYALFGDGGEGAWSHACIGIGSGTVDCHNNARQGISASGVMYKGINAILAP